MKKIIVLILALSLVIPMITKAQGGYTSVQYVMSFGAGDLGDYISKASFRGAVLEFQKNINSNFSAGFELAWNAFYEKKDFNTYTDGSVSVSGIQYRYSNNFPMLVTVEYNLMPEDMLKPFVNLGVGTIYTRRDTDMGVWTLQEEAWHFALKPEIGTLIEINPDLAFKLAAKYYIGLKSGDLETQSYIGISAGIAFQW